MRSVGDYLALIPPLNANKPNFRSVIAATVTPFAAAQIFLRSLPSAFDLDTAIGVQLDTVGKWAGISRDIPVPVVQLWFALDTPGQGLGQAPWQGSQINRSVLEPLNDDDFRRLIRAKIAANYSDGFVDGALAALTTYFQPPTLMFVADRSIAIKKQVPPVNFALGIPGHGLGVGFWAEPIAFALGTPGQGLGKGLWFPSWWRPYPLDGYPDISTASLDWTIGVVGTLPNAVDLEILELNLIPVQPLGVNVNVAVTTIDGAPLFGLGMGNEYVAGLGVGAWGASPDYVVNHVL